MNSDILVLTDKKLNKQIKYNIKNITYYEHRNCFQIICYDIEKIKEYKHIYELCKIILNNNTIENINVIKTLINSTNLSELKTKLHGEGQYDQYTIVKIINIINNLNFTKEILIGTLTDEQLDLIDLHKSIIKNKNKLVLIHPLSDESSYSSEYTTLSKEIEEQKAYIQKSKSRIQFNITINKYDYVLNDKDSQFYIDNKTYRVDNQHKSSMLFDQNYTIDFFDIFNRRLNHNDIIFRINLTEYLLYNDVLSIHKIIINNIKKYKQIINNMYEQITFKLYHWKKKNTASWQFLYFLEIFVAIQCYLENIFEFENKNFFELNNKIYFKINIKLWEIKKNKFWVKFMSLVSRIYSTDPDTLNQIVKSIHTNILLLERNYIEINSNLNTGDYYTKSQKLRDTYTQYCSNDPNKRFLYVFNNDMFYTKNNDIANIINNSVDSKITRKNDLHTSNELFRLNYYNLISENRFNKSNENDNQLNFNNYGSYKEFLLNMINLSEFEEGEEELFSNTLNKNFNYTLLKVNKIFRIKKFTLEHLFNFNKHKINSNLNNSEHILCTKLADNIINQSGCDKFETFSKDDLKILQMPKTFPRRMGKDKILVSCNMNKVTKNIQDSCNTRFNFKIDNVSKYTLEGDAYKVLNSINVEYGFNTYTVRDFLSSWQRWDNLNDDQKQIAKSLNFIEDFWPLHPYPSTIKNDFNEYSVEEQNNFSALGWNKNNWINYNKYFQRSITKSKISYTEKTEDYAYLKNIDIGRFVNSILYQFIKTSQGTLTNYKHDLFVGIKTIFSLYTPSRSYTDSEDNNIEEQEILTDLKKHMDSIENDDESSNDDTEKGFGDSIDNPNKIIVIIGKVLNMLKKKVLDKRLEGVFLYFIILILRNSCIMWNDEQIKELTKLVTKTKEITIKKKSELSFILKKNIKKISEKYTISKLNETNSLDNSKTNFITEYLLLDIENIRIKLIKLLPTKYIYEEIINVGFFIVDDDYITNMNWEILQGIIRNINIYLLEKNINKRISLDFYWTNIDAIRKSNFDVIAYLSKFDQAKLIKLCGLVGNNFIKTECQINKSGDSWKEVGKLREKLKKHIEKAINNVNEQITTRLRDTITISGKEYFLTIGYKLDDDTQIYTNITHGIGKLLNHIKKKDYTIFETTRTFQNTIGLNNVIYGFKAKFDIYSPFKYSILMNSQKIYGINNLLDNNTITYIGIDNSTAEITKMQFRTDISKVWLASLDNAFGMIDNILIQLIPNVSIIKKVKGLFTILAKTIKSMFGAPIDLGTIDLMQEIMRKMLQKCNRNIKSLKYNALLGQITLLNDVFETTGLKETYRQAVDEKSQEDIKEDLEHEALMRATGADDLIEAAEQQEINVGLENPYDVGDELDGIEDDNEPMEGGYYKTKYLKYKNKYLKLKYTNIN